MRGGSAVHQVDDGEFTVARQESPVHRLGVQVLRCRLWRIAELDVRQQGGIERRDVGDGAAGAGEVEQIDQDCGVRTVGPFDHSQRLRQVPHRHEAHELETASDVVVGREVAQFAEAIGEPVVVDPS